MAVKQGKDDMTKLRNQVPPYAVWPMQQSRAKALTQLGREAEQG